ncbi:MAG: inorganic phosphate transporter, partial [Nitrospiraceae bacterium]
MSDSSASQVLASPHPSDAPRTSFTALFVLILAGGLAYAGYELLTDLADVRQASTFAYVLLGIALLIALGFEFVNGFHDTANAVATVIYTHTL